jgi:hypothetical protein
MFDNIPLNEAFVAQLNHSTPLKTALGKLYFISLLEREDRAKYEWAYSDLRKEDVKAGIEELIDPKDIPHIVIASPNITAVFKFGDPEQYQKETNFAPSKMYRTASLEPIVGEDVSMACLAEVHIISLERRLWEDAKTVQEYLGKFIEPRMISDVKNPNKLREYLTQVRS